MQQPDTDLFIKGSQFLGNQLYLDAMAIFSSFADQYPASELADGALCNAGIIAFNLNDFKRAIGFFKRLIEQYPDSTISAMEGNNEFGRTAAKALYALVNCHLALSEMDKAQACANKLAAYEDSYIVVNGEKITFQQLAQKALHTFKEIA